MPKEFSRKSLKAKALSAVRSGDYDAAIENYRKYLALNPGDDDAWAGLGGAYRRKADIDQAIHSYEEAFDINRQSTYALVNVVSLRAARGGPEDRARLRTYLPTALHLTRERIESGEGDYWTWYDLATLQLLQGDVEEAARSFQYAADLTPVTAKENYRSVLDNLTFLQQHNPSIKGISDAIQIISRYLS
jgi:tetratricopeptide (TPR) repeat protein